MPPPYGCPTIVDLGCGVGHFARILFERGYKKYLGIDFSQIELDIAKKQVPQFDFWCADLRDARTWKVFEKYKIFVCFEVLEHIKDDLRVLKYLPGGATIIFSVPNIKGIGHVRYFKIMNEVIDRYESIISITSNQIVRYRRRSRRFLVHGIINRINNNG